MPIRAFLAVELPDAVRQDVAALQATLRLSGADVKWVDIQNLHLTLKFLGDIEDESMSAISDQLSATCQQHKPFKILLEGVGAFPQTTSPRVLWIGVAHGAEQLGQLAQQVEAACVMLGFPHEERPFSAHLTIGRVRSRPVRHPAARGAVSSGERLINALQTATFRASVPAPIAHVILFQSTLSPKGPTYAPLATCPLG